MNKPLFLALLAILLFAGNRARGQDTTALTHCDSLFNTGYGDLEAGLWEQSYDTLRLFMEQCPFYSENGLVAANIFRDVNAVLGQWQAGGAGRYADFLDWLKQVLYLNPDTSWYCQDVTDMISALQNDEAAQESALQYIIASGKCPGFDSLPYLADAKTGRHQAWLDSIWAHYQYLQHPPHDLTLFGDSVNADTLAHPYDSTIPTLQQVGLEILMGSQYADGVKTGSPSPASSEPLLSAQLIENPVVTDEIDISYQMGRTALVTLELRDVLGRSVPIANAKYQLESPGPHEATIPAPSLPSGTYYLRITTDAGDATTLKIVKQ